MLPKPDILQGSVEKLVSGGDGLIRPDGPVVFVSGALPGEVVRYRVSSQEKGYSRGEIVERITNSPDRRDPPCRYYGRCGGCDLMHLSVPAQRSAKQVLVQEAFRRIAKKGISLPTIVSGPDWGYRTRIQLHKSASDSHVGFMEKNSHGIVPIDECLVAAPAFGPLLSDGGKDLPIGRTLVLSQGEDFWVQGRDPVVQIQVSGKSLFVSTEGFFQSNLALLPEFLEEVLRGVPKVGKSALDLYCGVGLFGAFLADRFERVTAVEENTTALNLARKNISGPLHQMVASTLENWVRRLRGQSPRPLWDAIVVDPPRGGLSPQVRAFLAEFPTTALVYVSCNPDTLARDTVALESAGYRLSSLKLFDFYPQTSHIEAVAHFGR